MDTADIINEVKKLLAHDNAVIQFKDVVTWIVALAGIAATGAGLIHQLRKGLANTLKVQQENSKQVYQLKIYDDFSERVASWETASSRLSILVHQAIALFGGYFDVNLTDEVKKHIIPSWRIEEFNAAISESHQSFDKLSAWIALNDIVSPYFAVFRAALTSAMMEENTAYREFHPLLVKHLPIDVQDSVVFKAPTGVEYDAFKKAAFGYLHVLQIQRSYVADLETQVQNALLGQIFDRRADVRFHVEGVPTIRITTNDECQLWLKYFLARMDGRLDPSI